MSLQSNKNVLIVAGEASGDIHGANLVRAVRAIDPEVAFWGLGGEKMQKAGVEISFDSTKLAVVGISEVFTHLFQIIQAQYLLRKDMRNKRPNLIILIDYPDFNLFLAAKAKSLGIPVMYYISPQIWAWRSWRVKKIRRLVQRMVVILPFEVGFYLKHKINVDFVGHPLLDIVKPDVDEDFFCEHLEINRGQPIIGLFPGSRSEEVKRLLPTMLEAAKILEKRVPDIQLVLPLASTIDKNYVKNIVDESGLKVKIVENGPYNTMKVARALIVASGTVTLEAAIMGTPMVIIYKVSKLSYLIGRMMINIPYISLVNLVAEKKIVSELVQEEANGQKVAEEIYKIVADDKYAQAMRYELEKVKNKLGNPGASMRAAKIVCQILNR